MLRFKKGERSARLLNYSSILILTFRSKINTVWSTVLLIPLLKLFKLVCIAFTPTSLQGFAS